MSRSTPVTSPPRTRHATAWLLALILAGNFGLSIAGDNWGLPYIWHTDEKIDPAVHMIHQHTLDPDYFINPHLHIYVMAAVVKLAYLLNPGHTVMLEMHRIWGLLGPNNPGRRIQFMAMWGSRMLSALFALGAIVAVFRIGRRHFGEGAALLAAAFLAVTMGLVNLAHFATPESLLFWMMFLTLFECDRLATTGRTRDYALVGLFAGLAFATKYTAIMLAVPILVCHVFRLRWKSAAWSSLRQLAIATLVAFAAFAVTNPYAFIRWHDFVYWGFWFNWYTGAASGDLFQQARHSWIPYFWLMVDCLGWPLFVLGVTGVVIGVAHLWRAARARAPMVDDARARGFMIQLAWILPFYSFYGISLHNALRFIMPIVPSLSLLAAVAVATVYGQARSPTLRRAVVAVAAFVLLYSTAYTYRADWMFWHDTRYEAGRWLEEHRYTETERLYYFEGEAYLPYFDEPFPLKFFPFVDDTGGFPSKTFIAAANDFYSHATDPIVDSNFYWDRYTDRPWVYPERTAFYRDLLNGTDPAGYRPVVRFSLGNPVWLDPRPERIAPEIIVFGRLDLLQALGGKLVERVTR
ncbi:MAG: ArnT family glycosyltransferase [Vicinamibacterales bacterium]